jgi:hypothetical protein
MRPRLAALAAVVALLTGCPEAPPVLAPGTPVDGRSPEELSAQWWQWAMSQPEGTNPVADRTGAHCGVGQSGPVWFLAGGFGSTKVHRTCTVPAGRTLFFPLVNMVYMNGPAGGYTCERARAAAALDNDTALDLFATIDGADVADLDRYRVASTTCFDVFARRPESARPHDGFPAASDGFWLTVAPLPKGRHELAFGGRYASSADEYGRMAQDIEYTLVVE